MQFSSEDKKEISNAIRKVAEERATEMYIEKLKVLKKNITKMVQSNKELRKQIEECKKIINEQKVSIKKYENKIEKYENLMMSKVASLDSNNSTETEDEDEEER